MADFISILSFEGRYASYQITSDRYQTYTARLRKNTGRGEVPAEIVIHKNDPATLAGTNAGGKESLVNAIAFAEANERADS